MGPWKIGTLVFLIICVVLSALVACVVGQNGGDNLLVTLPELGKIQGSVTHSAWTNQEIYQFLSIPYAEAPSGNLRFKAPVPKKAWNNTVDGRSYGRRCPVSTHVNTTEAENGVDLEDCLTLCVYTKNFNANAPVMFYIYGGGFYNGTHADHPPHYLMEKDIVLVVPQFRLGALGWMSLRNKNAPGNMGFMDVLTALKWVQANVHIFGGNPANVTVFGQSAGAVQTSLLTMSPGVPDGLFTKVITASGSVFGHWAVNEKPIDLARNICKASGCKKCGTSDAIHTCLMKTSVPNLIKATSPMSFSPSTEDYFGYLPQPPAILANTYTRKYPVMAGATKHDGSFVTASIYDVLNAQLKGNWSGVTTRQLINMMFVADDLGDKTGVIKQSLSKLLFDETLLDSTDLKASIPAYIDLHGIAWMKSPVLRFLQTSSQNAAGDNYLYSFDYAGEHTRFGYEFGNDWYPFEGGVHHSNDNIYLWSTHKLNEKDTEMAKKMVEIWTSFAITGKPRVGDIDIPKFQGDHGPYFHINDEITIAQDFLDELVVSVRDPKRDELIRKDVPWGTSA